MKEALNKPFLLRAEGIGFVSKKLFALLAFTAVNISLLTACGDESKMLSVLEDIGLTEVKLAPYTSYDDFCRKNDAIQTDFIAKDEHGSEMRGTYCEDVGFGYAFYKIRMR